VRFARATLTAALCLAASFAAGDPIDSGAQPQDFAVARSSISGAFGDLNPDTAALFTSSANPGLVIDNTIFFGINDTPTTSFSQLVPGVPEPVAPTLIALAVSLIAARRR
jgi:hypothetical protein